jgi:hypothetical protein
MDRVLGDAWCLLLDNWQQKELTRSSINPIKGAQRAGRYVRGSSSAGSTWGRWLDQMHMYPAAPAPLTLSMVVNTPVDSTT